MLRLAVSQFEFRLLAFSPANGLPKREQVSIRRKHQQLALTVALVDRPIDIARGQSVELRLEFSVEPIDIANVDVIREAPIAGRSAVGSLLLQETETRCLAMHIRIVGDPITHFKPQYAGEEG